MSVIEFLKVKLVQLNEYSQTDDKNTPLDLREASIFKSDDGSSFKNGWFDCATKSQRVY